MFNKIAAAAAFAIVAVGAQNAAAQTAPTIVAGQYSGTTQFTAVNDPNGFCTGLVATGEVQPSEGSFALGKSAVVTTPLPGSASTGYGVNQQVCTYAKSPTALSSSGSTPANGTTVCTVPNPTYPVAHIVTGQTILGQSGTATINSVSTNAFKITTMNAALEVQISGAFTPICFISTDALFLRTGK